MFFVFVVLFFLPVEVCINLWVDVKKLKFLKTLTSFTNVYLTMSNRVYSIHIT